MIGETKKRTILVGENHSRGGVQDYRKGRVWETGRLSGKAGGCLGGLWVWYYVMGVSQMLAFSR